MAGKNYKDISGAWGGAVVTPSDATILPTTRGLWIGVTGNVTVEFASTTTPVELTNVPVGILPVQVIRVLAATTATGIVALY
jgi:hypothetical protein